jgi:predicted nuclease of restriction endonuclease-like (RecB) superfamily
MKLSDLSQAIQKIHEVLSQEAGRSVNIAVTIRNWLIGLYIQEYELRGHDRADYGMNALANLANSLKIAKIPSVSQSSLKQYRQFYLAYPQIANVISGYIKQLKLEQKLPSIIGQSLLVQFDIPQKTTQIADIPMLNPEKLISNLSYTHFVELMRISEPLKRSFYEIESIYNNWGARELGRQISTLYYERLGMSKNKEKIAKMVQTGTYAHDIKDVISDPYMFEFAGINKDDLFSENDLSKALIKQLSRFFLEMGRGFCF